MGDVVKGRFGHGLASIGRADAKISKVTSFFPFSAASCINESQRRGGIPLLRHVLTTLLLMPNALDNATVPPRASITESAAAAVMVVNIVRHWRTSQEFAYRMSTDHEISPLIKDMREYFRDQGRRLVAIRLACTGMNQQAFADEIGTSKGHLSDLENNKADLSLPMGRLIKTRWHLPLDFVLDGDIETLDQAPSKILRKLQELAA